MSDIPSYEELAARWLKEEEDRQAKLPAHRPSVPLFVDENDKDRIIHTLKTTIAELYNPISEKFHFGKVHFSLSRFWTFSYLAFVANNAIIRDNNVDSYIKLVEENIDKKYLVNGDNINKAIHNITNSDTDFNFFMSIASIADFDRFVEETSPTTTLVTKTKAWLVVRTTITNNFQEK